MALCTVFLSAAAVAEEAYLVASDDSSLTAFSLATDQQVMQARAPFRGWVVQAGVNPRLAFVVCNNFYLSVMDLTLSREVKRIYDVWGTAGGITPDGLKLLVTDDQRRRIDVVDTVSLQLVHKVSLMEALGANYSGGSIVVRGNKAYMAPTITDPSRPAVAVVDLTTYAVKTIAIPAGYSNGNPDSPNIALTPDEKYVVMLEYLNSNDHPHLLFIDAATDQLAIDQPITKMDPGVLLVSPKGTDPSNTYGYLAGSGKTEVVDLRPGSQSFGQEIAGTVGSLSAPFNIPAGAAINSDGSRIVLAGYRNNNNGPQPNVALLDTSKMLSNPATQLVSTHTVGGGARARGVTFAKITTTPPSSAPTVSGVQGTVVNNAAGQITITGTNFREGALVRIGKMNPIAATVDSGTTLRVMVPANAPADKGLDVVVTNPDSGNAPDQQYQSGLLAGALDVGLNPAFQPAQQFGSLGRLGGGSLSVYDMQQRIMKVVDTSGLVINGLAFNGDGAELFATTTGPAWGTQRKALNINLSNNGTSATISFTGNLAQYTPIARSVLPTNGQPAMLVPRAFAANNLWDIALDEIDSNPQSQNYNKVVKTITCGLGYGSSPVVMSVGSTPDGKFVFVFFNSQTPVNGSLGHLAMFDMVNGLSDVSDLGQSSEAVVEGSQVQIGFSEDGKTAVVNGYAAMNQAESMFVYDIGNPEQANLLGSVRAPMIPNAGNSHLYSYQVVGKRLFAYDWLGYVFAFNFDPQHKNFQYLAMYRLPGNPRGQGSSIMAVSPDGKYLYVPIRGEDAIAVLDANLLATGKMPLVTEIADQQNIFALAVSPVPPPGKPTVQPRQELQQRRVPTPPATRQLSQRGLKDR